MSKTRAAARLLPEFSADRLSDCAPQALAVAAGRLRRFADAISTVAVTTVGVGAFYGIAGMAQNGVIDAELLTRCLSIVCPLLTMVQYVAPAPLVADATWRMSATSMPTQAIILQAVLW